MTLPSVYLTPRRRQEGIWMHEGVRRKRLARLCEINRFATHTYTHKNLRTVDQNRLQIWRGAEGHAGRGPRKIISKRDTAYPAPCNSQTRPSPRGIPGGFRGALHGSPFYSKFNQQFRYWSSRRQKAWSRWGRGNGQSRKIFRAVFRLRWW